MFSRLLVSIISCATAAEEFSPNTLDTVQLLQVKANKQDKTDAATESAAPVNAPSAFDRCANFGGAAEMLGKGNFKPQIADKVDFCRCFGDTHCDYVPFAPFDDMGRTKMGAFQRGHYQYDGTGASRFAKASDGSWEVQIHQCGMREGLHPTAQNGVAIKVQGTVVEVIKNYDDRQPRCFVNGERKPPNYEIHLPTGFHFKCPGDNLMSAFCAVKDGQFVAMTNKWAWKNGLNQVLAVSKSADVDKVNNVCFDPSSRDNAAIAGWEAFGAEISTTAIVPDSEVIFTQIEQLRTVDCYLQDPLQSQQPPGKPADPQALCEEKGPGVWEQIQKLCSSLKDEHPAFYTDCLTDECLRADETEATELEEIAEEDDPSDEAAAVGDPHLQRSESKDVDMCCHHGHCSPCQ